MPINATKIKKKMLKKKKVKMPSGFLPLEVYQVYTNGMWPRGRPRIRWRDFLGMPWDLPGGAGVSLGRGMSGFLSWICSLCDLTSDKQKIMDQWIY